MRGCSRSRITPAEFSHSRARRASAGSETGASGTRAAHARDRDGERGGARRNLGELRRRLPTFVAA